MLRLLFTALGALVLSMVAHAEPYDAGHAEVELISERTTALPGETVYLALDKTLDEGWHVYWRNAGDAGLPPEIFWDEGPLGEKTEGEDFVWPVPKLLPVVEGEIMDYGYDDAVTLPFAVTVPEDALGSISFRGVADYLICKDVCIPESAPVSFTLFVGSAQEPDEKSAAKIAAALAAAPVPFEGEAAARSLDDEIQINLAPVDSALFADAWLRFFPFDNEIVHAADQAQSKGPQGASLTIPRAARETLGDTIDGVVVATRADGTRTGYTVSAKAGGQALAGTFGTAVSGIASDGGFAAAGGGLNLFALAGLTILGGLILNLMPCVLPVLSIKAMGMVSAASKDGGGHLRAHGLWYTAGVLASFAALAAAFVALRSVGEFWALGSLLQYPAVVAALALGAFVLGLWLLGVFEAGTSIQNIGSGAVSRGGSFGAFATGALAATAGAPCVGPFVGASLGAVLERPAVEVFFIYLMLGLGLALPFLLLSFVPNLARFLPKPGPWMERVKQFFAFPMFLTAAALLFVLGDQAGTGAVAWLVMGAALIAFGIWAMGAAGGRMRPAALVVGAIAIIGGLALPFSTARTQAAAATSGPTYSASVETEAWSVERVAQLTAEGRPVFVDFTATWCMICQANKRTTLTRPEVLSAMEAADMAFLVADFTNKDPAIAEELQRRGRPGVPMYLLFAPGESEPKILPQTLTPGLMQREIAAVTGN
ncbi:MAG: thioredoxin family protein [Pseudomonadota bacterium]